MQKRWKCVNQTCRILQCHYETYFRQAKELPTATDEVHPKNNQWYDVEGDMAYLNRYIKSLIIQETLFHYILIIPSALLTKYVYYVFRPAQNNNKVVHKSFPLHCYCPTLLVSSRSYVLGSGIINDFVMVVFRNFPLRRRRKTRVARNWVVSKRLCATCFSFSKRKLLNIIYIPNPLREEFQH